MNATKALDSLITVIYLPRLYRNYGLIRFSYGIILGQNFTLNRFRSGSKLVLLEKQEHYWNSHKIFAKNGSPQHCVDFP